MVTLRIGLTHKQVKTLISTSGPMSALWSNIRHLYKLCLCMQLYVLTLEDTQLCINVIQRRETIG